MSITDFESYPTSSPTGDMTYEHWNFLLAHGLVKNASYVMRKNGSYYEAINGDTGKLDYGGEEDAGGIDGTDASLIVQTVSNTLTALGGGFIFAKRGTYDMELSQDESNVILHNGVRLIGEGIGVTIFKAKGTVKNGVCVRMFELRKNASVENCTVDMNGANLTYESPYSDAWFHGILFGSIGVAVADGSFVKHIKTINITAPGGVTGLVGSGVTFFNGMNNAIYDVSGDNCDWIVVVSYIYTGDWWDSSAFKVDGVYGENLLGGGVYWEYGQADITNVFVKDSPRAVFTVGAGYPTFGTLKNVTARNTSDTAVTLVSKTIFGISAENIVVHTVASGYHAILLVADSNGYIKLENPQVLGVVDGYDIWVNDATGYYLVHGGKVTGTVTNAAGAHAKFKQVQGYTTENSGDSTGTGSPQTIAHELVSTPNKVSIVPTETGVTVSDVWADATNIYCTVTTGKTYNWSAQIV